MIEEAEDEQRNNYKMRKGEEEEKWKTPRRKYRTNPKKIVNKAKEAGEEQKKSNWGLTH